ncbi:hypothetical protein AAY473_038765 [Plecturocebus cupreus]
MEHSGAILLAHYNLHLPGSNDSPASASQHHARLIFVFSVKTGFHHVGQAGIELPTFLSLQSSRITIMSHCALLMTVFNRLITATVSTTFKFAKATSVTTAANAVIITPSTIIKPEQHKLEFSGMISAHCNPAPQVSGITVVRHHTWLLFVFLVETGFCTVGPGCSPDLRMIPEFVKSTVS